MHIPKYDRMTFEPLLVTFKSHETQTLTSELRSLTPPLAEICSDDKTGPVVTLVV